MQEISYQRLMERLEQCEMLAETAKDRAVREKAAELAQGYRQILSQAANKDRFAMAPEMIPWTA